MPALQIPDVERPDSGPSNNEIWFDEDMLVDDGSDHRNFSEMERNDLVSAILRNTGRTRDSFNYLSSVVPCEDPVDMEGHSNMLATTSNAYIAPSYNSLQESNRQEPDTAVVVENQLVLLGIKTTLLEKSYLMEFTLNPNSSLISLFSIMKQRKTSVAAGISHVEGLNLQEIYVGYGRQPLLLTDNDWDSYTNLVELGSWSDIHHEAITLQDINTVEKDIAQSFCIDNGKKAESKLYVIYIFSPIKVSILYMFILFYFDSTKINIEHYRTVIC